VDVRMAKHLVIVESPSKAKTINKFLGQDYVVKASMGHVRDLPQKAFGVDIDADFAPRYEMIRGKGKVVQELKKAARECDDVLLAPDPDREGEAIAWHLKALLQGTVPEDAFHRVTYHEITKPAIQQAFAHPSTIHMNRVDSQQARRVLDRLVGYMVSPLLWRRVKGGASAGRVQSVALRLLCEREAEIRDFQPEEYWNLGARACKQVEPRSPFRIRLTRIAGEKAQVSDGEAAGRILDDLERSGLRVRDIQDKETSKKARPPFITSTLQQAASTRLGFSPSRTMRIAQSLYEGANLGEDVSGLITYIRTDSVSLAPQAVEQCRSFIEATYGTEYLPEKPNRYRSRQSAQEAHEAIRPTDVTSTPDALKGVLPPDELKLYRLIWERFVACQMAPARIAQRSVEIESVPEGGGSALTVYTFRASASQVVFPGYMKATGLERGVSEKPADDATEDGEDEEKELPPLTVGEALDVLEWLKEQKFTQPPPRYSEASLVRALEENGVGRPSTYAQILATLTARKYAEKEKRTLSPTELGERVNAFLVEHLDPLFNVRFTARMEEELDQVEEGKREWVSMLRDFYQDFREWLKHAKGPDGDAETARRLLTGLGEVKDWAPETKRGKKVYSDRKFVESIAAQLEGEGGKLSERQVEALKKVAARYLDQSEALCAVAEELNLHATQKAETPREETRTKLGLLEGVAFDPPREANGRTYDDAAFYRSLKERVDGGRSLTFNQIRYLDRLLTKYGAQIEGFEEAARQLGLSSEASPEQKETTEKLLALTDSIAEWREPVQRGKRTWDDREFRESLRRQFREKQQLSPRQIGALRRMLKKYREQIPSYDEVKDELELG